MRRDTSAVRLGLWSLMLLAGAVSCRPAADTSPAARPEPSGSAVRSGAVTETDVFSGCAHGADHVRILIRLQPTKEDTCRAEVTPASVCVAPGGTVHFKVKSDCAKPAGGPSLKLTEPSLKRKGDGSDPDPGPRPALPGCDLEFGRVPPGEAEARTKSCDVGTGAAEGYYKYGLEGEIEPLDPDIEVRN